MCIRRLPKSQRNSSFPSQTMSHVYHTHGFLISTIYNDTVCWGLMIRNDRENVRRTSLYDSYSLFSLQRDSERERERERENSVQSLSLSLSLERERESEREREREVYSHKDTSAYMRVKKSNQFPRFPEVNFTSTTEHNTTDTSWCGGTSQTTRTRRRPDARYSDGIRSEHQSFEIKSSNLEIPRCISKCEGHYS